MPRTIMPGWTPGCLLSLSVLICSCNLFTSESPPNHCEQAEDLLREAYTRACQGQVDACCFCRCWNDGRKEYDQAQYRADGSCECKDAQEDRNCLCEGQRLAIAEKCLEGKETCRNQAMEFVTGESGLCTLTPIE